MTHWGMLSVVTVLAPESSTSSARKIASVPNVTMIEGTRPHDTRRPFTAPRPAPMPTARRIARGGAISGLPASVVPTKYAVKPTIDPTERS